MVHLTHIGERKLVDGLKVRMLQHLLAHEILGLPTGWVQRGLSFLLSCAGMATSLFVGFVVQLLEGSHPVQPPPFFLAFWFFFLWKKLQSLIPFSYCLYK